MTQRTRLLFDENFGKPAIERLARFLSAGGDDDFPEIKHILEFQEQGGLDEDWIPRMASEGWVLITADRGKKMRGKGEKLPRLCVKYGVTHVILSRRIQQRKTFDKILTLLVGVEWADPLEPRTAGVAIFPRTAWFRPKRSMPWTFKTRDTARSLFSKVTSSLKKQLLAVAP